MLAIFIGLDDTVVPSAVFPIAARCTVWVMVPRIGHESHDRNSRLFERFVLSHSMAVTFVVYCKTQLLFRDLIGHSIIQADNGSDHRAGTIILQAEKTARKPGFACITLLSDDWESENALAACIVPSTKVKQPACFVCLKHNIPFGILFNWFGWQF